MAEDQIQGEHLAEINALKIFLFFLDQLTGQTHYI